MSETGSETALVPLRGKPFQMPNFGKKSMLIQEKLREALKSTKLDIRNHVEKETSRSVSHLREQIQEGRKTVTSDQKDFGNIILRMKAINKKFDLERKIRHMGIHEGMLLKEEMEEKLRLLNENIKYLATNEDVIEEQQELEEEGDEESGRHRGSNRRSMDAIHRLEDKLGLPIAEKNQRIMNYKDKMHMSKEEIMKSQESAEQFVNKMKELERERKAKRKALKEKEKYKTQLVLDKTSQRRKEIEEEKKQKLQERIEKHQEMMEKEKEARAKRESNWKKFKVQEKKSKRLHEEIEERYKEHILMPELEKKKKELEDIRQFHKPIKREDLDEHEKNYLEKIKIEREKQRMKREKWYSDIGYGVFDENRYKTKFYEKALEEEKKKDVKERVLSQNRKRKQEKMNNYAKIVKEMHWPEVSERKRQELNELKEKIEHSNKPKFSSPNLRSRYNSSESPEREKILKKPNWKKFHNPMVPPPQPKREPVQIDWLGDRRKRRSDDEKTQMNQSQAWRSIADNKDLDENTRAHLLKTKARLLEENAQRKEQMNKVAGATMEGTVEVNEMLIDAIESKLSLLDNYI